MYVSLTKINNTFKKYSLTLIENIPYKIQIFLFGLYVWTWIFFQINKFIGFILASIIKYMPDHLISVTPIIPVKILKAFDGKNNDITNRLRFFMNYSWDNEMCDEQGGVDLEPFCNYISSSVVWVAYYFDFQVDENVCNQFSYLVELVEEKGGVFPNDENNPFKKNIKFILIDTCKKIIYRLKEDKIEKQDIIFGEIGFS